MIIGLKQLGAAIGIIMEGDVETPTRMVGREVVPVLRRDDGSFMAESMDIAHHLDRASAPAVIASANDAAIDAWAERAWPLMLHLCIPRFARADFRELATSQARAAFIARGIRSSGDLRALWEGTAEFLVRLQPQLEELETLLASGPADTLDESDFHLFPVLRSLTIAKDIAFGPDVRRYVAGRSMRCRGALFAGKAP